MSEEKIIELQDELSDHIHAIKQLFLSSVKVAIVIRNPSSEDGDVRIGDATDEDIRFVLARENQIDIPGRPPRDA